MVKNLNISHSPRKLKKLKLLLKRRRVQMRQKILKVNMNQKKRKKVAQRMILVNVFFWKKESINYLRTSF